MNLYEKLNRLDDKLVESKRVVKKKKLTEGISNSYEIDGKEVTWPEYFEYNMETNDYFMDEQLFSAFYDKAVELVEKEGFTDVFTEPSTQAGRGGDFFWATKDGVNYRGSYDYEEEQEIFYNAAVNADSEEEAIDNLAKAYAKLIISNLTVDEEYYDDDIDEMLTESTEQYELSTLVKDSINHLVNNLGKDSMADDFGDDVCADLEDNYDIDAPQNPVKYADWCDAVMSEVSRQLNNKDEQLKEGYSNEITEFMNWIQDYRNGALWNDFTAEFEAEQDPDMAVVLDWLEMFDETAYYDYIQGDDDIDEMLTENTRNNKLQSVADQIIKYAEEHPESLRNFKYMYVYIDNLSQEGRFEIPAKVGKFVLQDPENVTEVEAEEFINMLLDETDISDRLIQIKEANRKDAWDKLRKQFPSL